MDYCVYVLYVHTRTCLQYYVHASAYSFHVTPLRNLRQPSDCRAHKAATLNCCYGTNERTKAEC